VITQIVFPQSLILNYSAAQCTVYSGTLCNAAREEEQAECGVCEVEGRGHWVGVSVWVESIVK
jgi:hypothetical protein